MKECLAKIGIICNVKPTEFTVLYESLTEAQVRSRDRRLGHRHRSRHVEQTFMRPAKPRNYGQLFEPARRRAVRARPPRVRPRKARRNLRRDPQTSCGKISPTRGCSIATRSTASTRNFAATTSAARPVQFQPRLRQHLQSRRAVDPLDHLAAGQRPVVDLRS